MGVTGTTRSKSAVQGRQNPNGVPGAPGTTTRFRDNPYVALH